MRSDDVLRIGKIPTRPAIARFPLKKIDQEFKQVLLVFDNGQEFDVTSDIRRMMPFGEVIFDTSTDERFKAICGSPS